MRFKLIFLLVVVLAISIANGFPDPGRRGGNRNSGGSRSSSSSSGGSRGRITSAISKIKTKLSGSSSRPSSTTNSRPGRISSAISKISGSNRRPSRPTTNFQPTKPKSSLKKKFIKGAVIGAGAYVGYKAAKMVGKFATSRLHGHGYGLNDWNDWREVDGMLCRNNQDCSWINPQMYCQDYEVKVDLSSQINVSC